MSLIELISTGNIQELTEKLEQGADPNILEDDSLPLIKAMYYYIKDSGPIDVSISMVKVLIKHGADPLLKIHEDRPFDLISHYLEDEGRELAELFTEIFKDQKVSIDYPHDIIAKTVAFSENSEKNRLNFAVCKNFILSFIKNWPKDTVDPVYFLIEKFCNRSLSYGNDWMIENQDDFFNRLDFILENFSFIPADPGSNPISVIWRSFNLEKLIRHGDGDDDDDSDYPRCQIYGKMFLKFIGRVGYVNQPEILFELAEYGFTFPDEMSFYNKIPNGINVNIVKDGWTPLMTAAYNNNKSVCRFFLERGAVYDFAYIANVCKKNAEKISKIIYQEYMSLTYS